MYAITRTQNWLPSLFNDLFDDNFSWMPSLQSATPAVNILEDEKNYQIEMAAPGMAKEDLEVKVNNRDELVVSFGKQTSRKDDKESRRNNYLRREFSYNAFSRSFTLPDDVELEKIDAEMSKGVLCITLPKKDASQAVPTSRQINIR